MLGRLNLDAFMHDPIQTGGQVSLVLIGLAAIVGLTYFKKWGWLWKNWLTSLDPKKIGIMYLLVAVAMLLRGVADAGMMRAQQAMGATNGGSAGFLDASHFQQIFSAHGTIMIFFVAMGLMFGLINLILPLQLGARDVAFPFVNSVGFWLFTAGMVLINVSLMVGEFSAAGWLAYPPLSGLEYSPGVGVDYLSPRTRSAPAMAAEAQKFERQGIGGCGEEGELGSQYSGHGGAARCGQAIGGEHQVDVGAGKCLPGAAVGGDGCGPAPARKS